MFEYVYLRDNPRGPHEELWFHSAGCQAWLVVRRDTATHEIESVKPATKEEPMQPAAQQGERATA